MRGRERERERESARARERKSNVREGKSERGREKDTIVNAMYVGSNHVRIQIMSE